MLSEYAFRTSVSILTANCLIVSFGNQVWFVLTLWVFVSSFDEVVYLMVQVLHLKLKFAVTAFNRIFRVRACKYH